MYSQLVVVDLPDGRQCLTLAHPRDGLRGADRRAVAGLPMNELHRRGDDFAQEFRTRVIPLVVPIPREHRFVRDVLKEIRLHLRNKGRERLL